MRILALHGADPSSIPSTVYGSLIRSTRCRLWAHSWGQLSVTLSPQTNQTKIHPMNALMFYNLSMNITWCQLFSHQLKSSKPLNFVRFNIVWLCEVTTLTLYFLSYCQKSVKMDEHYELLAQPWLEVLLLLFSQVQRILNICVDGGWFRQLALPGKVPKSHHLFLFCWNYPDDDFNFCLS